MTILRSTPISDIFGFNSMVSGNNISNNTKDIVNFDVLNDEVLLTFNKKYEVLDILGKGVSGVVHGCKERESGRMFAVKIVDLVDEEEGLEESTISEVTILQQLTSHPYIIDLHESFISSTHILLVMELCTKELFDVMTEVVRLSEIRTRQIMRQLLTAIEFMHSKKIAHRDIKAENILIDSQNNIKLTDFGFACKFNEDNLFSDLCGTFEYLSPELVRNQLCEDHPGFGKSIDIWACGILMYTLLQGSSPFWAPEKGQVLRNIISGKLVFSHPIWNDYSGLAKDLISNLLKVDCKERLTATQSLQHPFFTTFFSPTLSSTLSPTLTPQFLVHSKSPRVRLKGVFLAVLTSVFLRRSIIPTVCVSQQQATDDPYTASPLRRLIDYGAFKIYGHWVNRDCNQSREVLFQNSPYCDKKTSQK